MITAKQASDILLKKFPQREIIRGCKYKDNYLFVAPDKKLGEFGDFNNPYFIVDSGTGKVTGFSPLTDLDGLSEAMQKNPL